MPRKPSGSRTAAILALFLLAPLMHGCAGGASIAILQSSAGSVASSGVEHTFEGGTAKTYTASALEVAEAYRKAVEHMGFRITDDRQSKLSRKIEAESATRDVDATIEVVASNAARLTVSVDRGFFLFRDTSTATEIVVQTAIALKDFMDRSPVKADRDGSADTKGSAAD